MSHHGIDRQGSFELDDVPEAELNLEEMEKALKEFRDGGGRYNYSEEYRSHFDIKYW